ncbi:MAG: glycosyltransferase [Ardenticatenaceae bacterium]|nr:glycosyltransferase [Anaerolineales bacterium]MCB8923255.1 glycosyltransferase [Ardenticatenaceae bacterium]MCB9004800.1 glycosyltransferase [Ardenticatenaceae bacterium]
MTRYGLIGPTYPYRGGIAHYTTLLAEELRQEDEVLLISFSQQYPHWLFPGRSDRDPSERPLRTDAEYLLNPLNPLSWWRTLRRLRQWQPDVVIIPWWVLFWAPVWAVLGQGIKRLPSRPKLLFICHNVLPHEQGNLRFLLPYLTRMALAAGDGYVVHAQADGAMLQQLLPDAGFLVTPHPTYAALGKSSASEMPVSVPDDCPLVLFVGFVRPYKGLDVLLEAMALVLKNRQLHLLVAGEFWQGTEMYREQIARLGIGGAVTLLDAYLPDEALAACIQRADVVALPYRSATQSGIIQAAFGQGKPVITTAVGGLAEVVEHEETGLVVPPENAAALAAAIERFFAENLGPTFAQKIVEGNGRFSWQQLIITLQQLANR